MEKLVLLFIMFLPLTMLAGGGENDDAMVSTSVRIVDAQTGEPIIGAGIRVEGQDEVYYTDPDGYVLLNHLSSKELQIEVSYISYPDFSVSLEELAKEGLIVLSSY